MYQASTLTGEVTAGREQYLDLRILGWGVKDRWASQFYGLHCPSRAMVTSHLGHRNALLRDFPSYLPTVQTAVSWFF